MRVYQVVVRLPLLVAALKGHDGDFTSDIADTYTAAVSKLFENLVKLQELVESTIDLKALENHEYIIKPEFDEQLAGKKLYNLQQHVDVQKQRRAWTIYFRR